MIAMIALNNVQKIYTMGETKVYALRGADLEVSPGEFVAIMGASGSGKSTLMNILGCLDIPTSGTYSINGVNVAGMTKNQLADLRNEIIGFVFQGFNLLSKTSALENVELPLLYRRKGVKPDVRKKALAALTSVGLGNRINHESTQLSGGQQQRIAIARALVNDPKLILADEPTGNLDSSTSIDIMSIFQKLNDSGISIVLVTHEPDIARYAKRLIEMRDGKIIKDHMIENRSIAAEELKKIGPINTEDDIVNAEGN
jgi:putative ABC transport system ATP-binding protein